MISDDTSRAFIVVFYSEDFLDLDKYRSETISLIDTLHTIERDGTSLYTHTSIYTLCRKSLECVSIDAVVLHEYIVPEFHPFFWICSDIRTTRRLPLSHPVKYLSIWTTRTSWTRCPPVILGRKSSNTFITEVESILFPDIFPDLYRLSIEWSILISGEYCHRYHLRIKPKPFW
jgi:hypothetical protein